MSSCSVSCPSHGFPELDPICQCSLHFVNRSLTPDSGCEIQLPSHTALRAALTLGTEDSKLGEGFEGLTSGSREYFQGCFQKVCSNGQPRTTWNLVSATWETQSPEIYCHGSGKLWTRHAEASSPRLYYFLGVTWYCLLFIIASYLQMREKSALYTNYSWSARSTKHASLCTQVSDNAWESPKAPTQGIHYMKFQNFLYCGVRSQGSSDTCGERGWVRNGRK